MTIIAIIISVFIPITQNFLTRAKILDANLKAKTIADVVNRYLLEQELAGNGMTTAQKRVNVGWTDGHGKKNTTPCKDKQTARHKCGLNQTDSCSIP